MISFDPIVPVRSSQATSTPTLVLCATVLLLISGCSRNRVTISRAEYQRLQDGESRRFQPFTNGVAFDTRTGQHCKTYDWHTHLARRTYSDITPSPDENAPLCTAVDSETDSRDLGRVTIPRIEYEQLQAAQPNRFRPFGNLAGVALDTRTGQVCKTADWQNPSARVPKAAISSPYENSPLCATLP